jgi:cold shock CspA family protein
MSSPRSSSPEKKESLEYNQYRDSDTSLGWSPIADRQVGQVLWFQPKKGYGMLRNLHTKQDIFIHQSALKTETNVFRQLFAGEYVEYYEDVMSEIVNMNENKTKRIAVDVTGIAGNPLMCEYQVLNHINHQNQRGGNGHQPFNVHINHNELQRELQRDAIRNAHSDAQRNARRDATSHFNSHTHHHPPAHPSYQPQTTSIPDYPILVPQKYKHMISPEVVKTTYSQYQHRPNHAPPMNPSNRPYQKKTHQSTSYFYKTNPYPCCEQHHIDHQGN